MYCDSCGKKSPEELDQLVENYSGEYYCSEECRERVHNVDS